MDGVKIRSFGGPDQASGPWSTGGGRQKRQCSRSGRGIGRWRAVGHRPVEDLLWEPRRCGRDGRCRARGIGGDRDIVPNRPIGHVAVEVDIP